MKKKTLIGYIKMLILTILIIACILIGIHLVKVQYDKAKIKTIKTNMSLVELKASEYINKQKADGKEEISYVGTKLSETTEKDLVKGLTEKGIITDEELEKYYIISDEDLIKLNAKFSNEEKSFYIYNYETGTVIISSGCEFEEGKILYKLEDIEKMDE